MPCSRERVEHLAVCLVDLVELQADDVEVQAGVAVRMLPGAGNREVCEQCVVAGGERVAAGDVIVEAGHLADAERGLQFGHAVVEAEINLLVVPGAVGGHASSATHRG